MERALRGDQLDNMTLVHDDQKLTDVRSLLPNYDHNSLFNHSLESSADGILFH